MRTITQIILHCSASEFGDVAEITRWHRARGFQTIGYHFVVLNGYRTASAARRQQADCAIGEVEVGRPVAQIGAHVVGHNRHSIGVCLIGDGVYPEEQLEAARCLIVEQLMREFPGCRLIGHCELDAKKSCPLLDMDKLRSEWGMVTSMV